MRFTLGVAVAASAGVGLGLWLRPVAHPAPPPASARGEHLTAAPRPTDKVARAKVAVKQRDLDATHPHYDAVALLGEEEGRLKADEIFEAEPRDPKIAPIFERRVTTRVETYLRALGLDERVKVASVECKTLSCSTVLEVDPKQTTAVYDLVNGIMLGDVHSPGFDEATGHVTS